jgi:hypothetical protein
MKSPKKFMSACLFSLTDRNFFQSGIFLPSTTWNTFVWAITLVRRSLSADLMEFFLRHTGQIHLLLTPLKCKSGEIITGHINPEIVFRRALAWANRTEDVTIDNILSHPVGPIPVSMFHEDGTMRKSCKSNLVKQFENEVSPVLSFLLVFFDR